MSRFKIGDRAWNIGNPWVEIEEVEIKTKPIECLNNNTFYYRIKEIGFPGIYAAKENDLFKTKEEAIKENERRNNKRTEKILNEIHSVPDLLNMMFQSMYCDEYTNYEKIEVAKRKAKELLGVELKR